MYSLRAYGDMIGDAGRFDAYANAIAKAVRPGDVVAEIGCGPGVFSFLACKSGAKKVYAIESADIVYFAQQLASANGLRDRIDFVQADSRRVELPERANVVVSDVRGSLPFFEHAVETMEDAHQRFLAPNGIFIPQRDTLKVAVANADEYYLCLTKPWRGSMQGLELSSTLSLILNDCYSVRFKSEQLLTEAENWGVLDYSCGAQKRAAAKLNFLVQRSGTAHGLCLWFETQLFENIGYSSGPGGSSTVYGQTFLPWREPVDVAQGHRIQVELHADLVGAEYVWRWETIIETSSASAHYQQSTFQGANFSWRSLQRWAADFVPQLSETGEAERWLLQAMDGRSRLRDIAEEAAKRFPRVFSDWDEAFRQAAELSGKYSR